MTRVSYERLTCFYASGTGNSYQAAQWLGSAATSKGIASVLIPIDKATTPREDLQAGPGQLVGIYHPSHGLMPPWSMIKFLFRLPWGRGAHAVAVATRGGFPLGPLVVPGGAGLALFFPLLVLLLKGYRVRAGLGMDMPANMLNMHWGMKPHNVEKIINWGRRHHQRLVDRVLDDRRYFSAVNLLWELVWCFPFVLYPLFPIVYLLVARVFMAKIMFADRSCTGCGSCARTCPSGAITMVGPKPKTPYWTHRCEVCMRCMGYCPHKSVQASHLWLIPVIYGTSFLSATLMQNLVARVAGQKIALWTPAWELLSVLLVFLSLPLFYYVLWGMMRLKPLRTFFTYTTLTKLYPRRYGAPGTTARKLTRRSDEAPGPRTHSRK